MLDVATHQTVKRLKQENETYVGHTEKKIQMEIIRNQESKQTQNAMNKQMPSKEI